MRQKLIREMVEYIHTFAITASAVHPDARNGHIRASAMMREAIIAEMEGRDPLQVAREYIAQFPNLNSAAPIEALRWLENAVKLHSQ